MLTTHPCFARETQRNTLISLRVSPRLKMRETRFCNPLKSRCVSVFRVFLPLKGESTARNTRQLLPLWGPLSRRSDARSVGALGRSA
jgi:hypothetical protein